MKFFINKVKYIRLSRFKIYKDFLDYAGVNYIFNFKSRIILIAKLKHNNYFILDDILDYNFLSDN